MSQLFNTVLILVIAFLAYSFLSPSRSSKDSRRSDFVEKLNESYDYIVVGSGSAGSAVAGRLSEVSDVTVLLLEAGGDDRDHEIVRSEWQNIKAVIDPVITRAFYPEPQENILQGLQGRRSSWPRGVILGGSSSINGMLYVRGNRRDYDRWAEYTGDKSWDYKHVLPYFIRAEGMTEPNLKQSPYHGTEGPQKISQTGKNSNMADAIVAAFKELGYSFNEDYNGKTQEGISYGQANLFENERMSSAMSYVHPNLGKPNLHVSIYSFVQKIVFDEKNRAVGVWVIKNNRKVFVRARKEIILSAGAIQTPQILMLSGVGPKAELQKLGIPVVADLPVGQNLQDHVLVFMSVSVTSPLEPQPGRHSQENVLHTSTTEKTKALDWPDLQILYLSRRNDRPTLYDYWNFEEKLVKELLPSRQQTPYAWICCPTLMRPSSFGNLTLRSTDPFDDPLIFANYLHEREDVEVLLRGIEICKASVKTDVMTKAGARLSDPKISYCKHHPTDSPAYWECYARTFLSTVFHYSGTCRMGSDKDASAVVDTQLRVKKVKGLRVADNSIMPFVTSANTHGPAVLIGEKAADMILGRNPLPPLDL